MFAHTTKLGMNIATDHVSLSLLVKTGGGKTTVCQVLSAILRLKLNILNCHQYTETSDSIVVSCHL
jgi:midasin (ATPase involved in ribosome maturation)